MQMKKGNFTSKLSRGESKVHKLIKSVMFVIILICPTIVFTQNGKFPALPYKPMIDFLKLPEGLNFEEIPGIAINSKGHIFIFHRGDRQLMEFDPKGNFIRSIADGLFSKPHGLRIDSNDNIWITDIVTHVVLKLSPAGKVMLVLGRKDRAGETDMLFNQPTDIAIAPNGEIFVTDGYGNSRVVKFDQNGNYVKTWGKKGSAPGQFNLPHSIVLDSEGLLYVADRENKRIQIFDTDGNFIKEWSHVGAPWGLFIDKDKYIYMTDGYTNRLLKMDLNGKVLGEFGAPGKSVGQFFYAHGVAVTNRGEILVTEIINWRVQKLVDTTK